MSNPDFVAPDYTTQTASAYKANIDASVAANGSDVINIGFSYSGGTFTVHDAQGTALSSTNPAFVRFQDKANPGYYKYISLEANQAFIDDAGSSEIINNLFGFPTGVAVANDVTFYIYAVANDDMDTVALMISRDPWATNSPAAANIGAPDDAVADAASDFWSLDNLDETVYDSNPCTRIGSFRMQMSASDDWTVQTINTTSDGIKPRPHERASDWTFISSAEASASATVDLTLPEEYKMFKIVLDGVTAATSAADLLLRTSNDGGSSFDSGASDYIYEGARMTNGGWTFYSSTADTDLFIADNDRTSDGGFFGEILIYAAGDSSESTHILTTSTHTGSGGTAYQYYNTGGGRRAADQLVNAVRFLMDSGNIGSGKFYLYGRKEME